MVLNNWDKCSRTSDDKTHFLERLCSPCSRAAIIARTLPSPPGSLPTCDCNQPVANLRVVGRSVGVGPAVIEICDVNSSVLLCHITKFNNVQEDVDDLVS